MAKRDGILILGRYNANGADLNRNFPSLFQEGNIKVPFRRLTRQQILNKLPSNPYKAANNDKIQPETKAIMKWVVENPFVLSLILHGGAAGVFYSFDDGKVRPKHDGGTPSRSGYLSATPDNEVMKLLADKYSFSHQDMYLGKPCVKNHGTYYFPNGTSNGAEWYPLAGSMGDFNYLFSNCFEITVEVTCCKKPDARSLPAEWLKNRNSLLTFLEQAHMGVKGLVRYENGTIAPNADIIVANIDKIITTSSRGEYWRLLVPGKYRIHAKENTCDGKICRKSDIKTVTTRKDRVLRMDFVLKGKSKLKSFNRRHH